MMNFSAEMIEKAKAAKTVEELLEIAKAEGVEMTEAEAKTYFAQLEVKGVAIDDDDLDSVAGGYVCSSGKVGDTVRVISGETCPTCGSDTGTVEKWGTLGDRVVLCNNCPTHTVIGFEGDITFKKI